MRSFTGESTRIARQNCSTHAKRKLVVNESKTFQQPHTEKARASGDKKRFATGFGPQISRVLKHMRKVFGWERFYGLRH
jgi:hypothetical protein